MRNLTICYEAITLAHSSFHSSVYATNIGLNVTQSMLFSDVDDLQNGMLQCDVKCCWWSYLVVVRNLASPASRQVLDGQTEVGRSCRLKHDLFGFHQQATAKSPLKLHHVLRPVTASHSYAPVPREYCSGTVLCLSVASSVCHIQSLISERIQLELWLVRAPIPISYDDPMGGFRRGQRGHAAPKMPSPEILSRFCLKCTKFDQLILAGIVKIIDFRCHS